MPDWTDIASAADDTIFGVFGRTTIYQRTGFEAFELTGVPTFLSRLEDVNRGQFVSMNYRLADFVVATFKASVVVTFSGAPASNGTLTFDGVAYTSKGVLDNGVPNQFLRGSLGSQAADNLVAAINAEGGAGTIYSSPTEAHPTCSASIHPDLANAVVVSYRETGISGDGIEAVDAMSSASLDARFFYGGGPLTNDLVVFDGILYRVSDDPAKDAEGGVQLRLLKKAV